MTIEEVARNSNVKVKTVKNKIESIKGITVDIIPGTRYPYNLGSTSLKTREDKEVALMTATCRSRYIDNEMLNMEQESFACLISELCTKGLLQENGTNNPYGANAYDVTIDAGSFLRAKKQEKINMIASAVGSIFGAYMKQNM